MTELYKGAPIAAALTARAAADAAALREKGVVPCLALLRVGQREDDMAYERAAVKRCAGAGIETRQIVLPENVSQETLIREIKALSADGGVHGVLMFRPLPKTLDEAAACAALSPEKDVDGITAGSLAGVFMNGRIGFPPCTAAACIALLDHYGVSLEGRRVTVVGRSLVIGKPVAMLLLARHATVTICHTRTKDLAGACRSAEILVVAAGKVGAVGMEALNPGQIVLDVGVHVLADGSMRGDVDFDPESCPAAAITPVPGGVGTVTTSVLAAHVVEAAKRSLAN